MYFEVEKNQNVYPPCVNHGSCIPDETLRFLKAHPEYNWQKPYLKDLLSHAWTVFQAKDYQTMLNMIKY